MILFHGSNMPIEYINLNKCRPYKDFGRGFYLTTIEEQSITMAKRISKIYGDKPCVTSFEFDESSLKNENISTKIFDSPSRDWAIFVLNNRDKNFQNIVDINCNHDNKYDIVVGSVANDDIALLFRTFSNGLINIETLVKEMRYKKLTDQYSFHTEKSLSFLTKVGEKSYE
jgi:hypothetical protein